MIAKEQYQLAVNLYNKTINVLTKHSGVLSLKNIKERTELMMIELRGKVTNLLDDSKLEITKLSQYVIILRMMQASKPQVVQKFIAAHVSNAKKMINSFQTSNNDDTVNSASSVSKTRQFHQLLVAGLIEACNGVHELFCNIDYLGNDAISQTHDSKKDSSENIDKDIKDHENAYKLLVKTTEEIIVSNYCNIMLNRLKDFMKDYYDQYDEVKSLEIKLKSFNHEASHINQPISSSSVPQEDESSGTPSGNEKDLLERQLHKCQLKLYELEDESQNWYLLARQAILDVIYLEKTMLQCSPDFNIHSKESKIASSPKNTAANVSTPFNSPIKTNATQSSDVSNSSFSKQFAVAILTVLGSHVDYLFWRRLTHFVDGYIISSLNIISLSHHSSYNFSTAHSNSHNSSHNDLDGISSHGHSFVSTHGYLSSSSSHGDPTGIRFEIQRRITEVKGNFDKLYEQLVSTFSDILVDIKPIIDVYSTVLPPVKSVSSRSNILYSQTIQNQAMIGSPSPTSSGLNVPTSLLIPNTINGYHFKPQTNPAGSSLGSGSVNKSKVVSSSTSSSLIRSIQRNVLGVCLMNIPNTSVSFDDDRVEAFKVQSSSQCGHDYVNHLVWSYCCSISQVLEQLSEVRFSNRVYSTVFNGYTAENYDGIETIEPTHSYSEASGESSFFSQLS